MPTNITALTFFYSNYMGGASFNDLVEDKAKCSYNPEEGSEEGVVVAIAHLNCTDTGIEGFEDSPRAETSPTAVLYWVAVYLTLDILWAISALFLDNKIGSES